MTILLPDWGATRIRGRDVLAVDNAGLRKIQEGGRYLRVCFLHFCVSFCALSLFRVAPTVYSTPVREAVPFERYSLPMRID